LKFIKATLTNQIDTNRLRLKMKSRDPRCWNKKSCRFVRNIRT